MTIEVLARAAWIDRCVMTINRLNPRAAPDLVVAVATELYEFEELGDPFEVARVQCDEWPPHET